MKQVEVIQVIRTTLAKRGDGSEEDPHRHITQYWTLDGNMLAQVDPANDDPATLRFTNNTCEGRA